MVMRINKWKVLCRSGTFFTVLRVDSLFFFFFSSRRRHTRLQGDWSSDVCSSDLLADWLRQLREEAPIQRADAAINEIAKDRDQRRNHQNGGDCHRSCSRGVGDPPAKADAIATHDYANALAGMPRVTLHTSRRASAFTIMVTRNRASPISISALR